MKEVKEWASSYREEEHSRQGEQSVQRPWDGPGICEEQPGGHRASLQSAGENRRTGRQTAREAVSGSIVGLVTLRLSPPLFSLLW